jgi:hypothetical protein
MTPVAIAEVIVGVVELILRLIPDQQRKPVVDYLQAALARRAKAIAKAEEAHSKGRG